MAEAMSYMAGSELPMVLINVMRGGPGLGSIQPSQSDYFQATKGHGHGDYRVPVLAPSLDRRGHRAGADAFEIAERYRTPVMILTDGIMGQAMEPVVPRFRRLPGTRPSTGRSPAPMVGRRGSSGRSTCRPRSSKRTTAHLQAKYRDDRASEVRWAGERLDDAEIAIVAYGTAARVAPTAIDRARGRAAGRALPADQAVAVPDRRPSGAGADACGILVVELSAGQMVEDVRLAVEGRTPVHFHGRMGGMVPTPGEVVRASSPRSSTSRPDPSAWSHWRRPR